MIMVWIIVKQVIKKVNDNIIVFFEISGATSNLFKKPNSLSKTKGRPEFSDPVNDVKIIIPELKNGPYL